jgi:hypothetical protein
MQQLRKVCDYSSYSHVFKLRRHITRAGGERSAETKSREFRLFLWETTFQQPTSFTTISYAQLPICAKHPQERIINVEG